MWLTLENLLREKLSNDRILFAWPIRNAAWNLTKFQMKNDRRDALLRFSGEAYTSRQQTIRTRDGALESGLARLQ